MTFGKDCSCVIEFKQYKATTLLAGSVKREREREGIWESTETNTKLHSHNNNNSYRYSEIKIYTSNYFIISQK